MLDPADHLTLPLPVTGPMAVRLMLAGRLHTARLFQDLLGDWSVIQSWTGRDRGRGGGKIVAVQDEQAGLALLQEIVSRQRRQGYVLQA